MKQSLLANINFREIFEYPIKNTKDFSIFFCVFFIANFILFKLLNINIYLVLPFFVLFPTIDYFFFRRIYTKTPTFEAVSMIKYFIASLKLWGITIILSLISIIVFLLIIVSITLFVFKVNSYKELSGLLNDNDFMLIYSIIGILTDIIITPYIYRIELTVVGAAIKESRSIIEVIKQTKNYYLILLVISGFAYIPTFIEIKFNPILNNYNLIVSFIYAIIRIINLLLLSKVYNFFFKPAK